VKCGNVGAIAWDDQDIDNGNIGMVGGLGWTGEYW
jgi:hypothetical protein